MKYLLTQEETAFYIDYLLNETSLPYDDLGWLIYNLTNESKRELKSVIRILKKESA